MFTAPVHIVRDLVLDSSSLNHTKVKISLVEILVMRNHFIIYKRLHIPQSKIHGLS